MRIYAIADLHLSLVSEKPMDVFGEAWRDHADKIDRNWREVVQEDDLVLIPGDISWAMQLSAALPDLAFIGHLPGKKILLRGNHDYWWSAIGRVRASLPAAARALAPYREQGLVHKWAVLDAVLGNPDRHAANVMIDKDDKVLALIDHGSAFAGPAFDPAHDKNSFVPFYLRAWSPGSFNSLSLKSKLAQMPEVSDQVRDDLRQWLNGIHADHLQSLLHLLYQILK